MFKIPLQGDLAKKKIFPTLWWLFRDNLLPTKTAFFGYARSKTTIAELREKCHQYMQVKLQEQNKYEQFWKIVNYVSGNYDSSKDFENLNRELCNHEKGSHANRIFYLALPPSVFEPVTVHIKKECMGQK